MQSWSKTIIFKKKKWGTSENKIYFSAKLPAEFRYTMIFLVRVIGVST